MNKVHQSELLMDIVLTDPEVKEVVLSTCDSTNENIPSQVVGQTSNKLSTSKQDGNAENNDKVYISKSGYEFYENDYKWRLDKNHILDVTSVIEKLPKDLAKSYRRTLAYFAVNSSSSHTLNIHYRFLFYLRAKTSSDIDCNSLISFRAKLNRQNEWYLFLIRILLRKWYELGYAGVSEDVVDLLESWSFKGNRTGEAVKRLDPEIGPLSDVELLAFNEGAAQAFEQRRIKLYELAFVLLLSHTGRRPIQLTHLRLKDLLKGENEGGGVKYLVNIPRAKQYSADFRSTFKAFAISDELWIILDAHVKSILEIVKSKIAGCIPKQLYEEMPLFPDLQLFDGLSEIDLRKQLEGDFLHMPTANANQMIAKVIEVSEIHSERTGEILKASSRRFRYTKGTRAAREGFGELVIAELLDHSDTQHAKVYVQNIPEFAGKLDEAIGDLLVPYAKAFVGAIVDEESFAERGEDPASRVRFKDASCGTCGGYSKCGANVPIPCYTCYHFQPWLNAPHESIYQFLVQERNRILDLTGDLQVASINDRTIAAVTEVISQCNARKEEVVEQGIY
ncbi:site-specific integrase [Endozoicomonas sp. SESOKO1]|uniref:site-specific integrase n=1 Tax=Endozoicomonas sp. SESOKO1 TaxID=2828742 RepID=UPI002147852F|nr:site-specific integrase [Endozoicomonas sp. SESOKO1]